MPIYEYICDTCEHEFETIQKISEDPLKTCPECEQEALRKKVTAAAFRLKGGGWYETDFKSGSKRNVATEDKKSSESETKSDSGSGTTPEKKDKSKADSSSKSDNSTGASKPSKSASSD